MKNVLLIDDDEIILKVLEKLLEQKGFHVITGCNGREGLEKLELMPYDLIISDIMMPYLNGFEFIESLKIHPHSIQAKVMIITSITHQESINESLKMGVDYYFPKPILIDKFVALIDQIFT